MEDGPVERKTYMGLEMEVGGYEKIELKDVKPYEAPGHFNMTAMRLQGKDETVFLFGLLIFIIVLYM